MDSAKNSVKSYQIYPPTSFFDLSVRVVTPPGTARDDEGTAPPTQIRLVLREKVSNIFETNASAVFFEVIRHAVPCRQQQHTAATAHFTGYATVTVFISV